MGFRELVLAHDTIEAHGTIAHRSWVPKPIIAILFFGMTIELYIFRAMLKPSLSFTCLLIKSLRELVDWWWYLQPSLEDSLLSLKTDIFWPSYKSAQISLGLDILANSKVTRAFFEQWVDYPLLFWLLDGKRSCCYLLSLLLTLKSQNC